MGTPLKVLIVEDDENDALLMLHELKRAGYDADWLRVDDPAGFRKALADRDWDIILSALKLSAFTGADALRTLQGTGLDIPVLIVSGSIDEEAAASVMRAGANDYFVKGSLGRLGPAVERELRESRNRRSRREQEAALRTSERLLQTIIETTPECIKLLDENANLLMMNRAGLDMIQVEAEEQVRGQCVCPLIISEHWPAFLDLTKRVFRGESGTLAFEITGMKGRRLWLETHAVPLRDEQGRVTALLGVTRDITGRKMAEDALRASEERFQLAMRGANDGLWDWDLATDEVYYSPRWKSMLGYAEDELEHTLDAWKGLVHPDDMDRTLEAVHALVEGRSDKFEVEFRMRHKDGSWRHILSRAFLAPVEGGAHPRLVGTHVDISERKRSEDDLRESHQFLQAIMDGVAEPILVVGSDYRVIMMNKVATEIAKTVPDGRTCHEISHRSASPCSGAGEVCPLEEVLRTGMPVSVLHEHTDGDGRTRFIEILASPFRDASGRIVGIIESSRDITERKKAEEERLQLERQVQHAQKLESLGVLAGGIAHDFNNILMGIMGNAGLALMRLPDDSPARGNLREIERASRRAADLATQMLAYSGKGRFVIGPIDLTKLVEEMARLLEVSISKKATLIYRFERSLPALDGDATQVRQVVMNLITNASEALGEEGGVISLTTGVLDCDRAYLDSMNEALRAAYEGPLSEGRYVYLEVSDTGRGMDEATQRRIFEPFFTTKFTGRGLGMAAVLGIIRGHRGAIRISSTPGSGTVIRVLFPTKLAAESAQSASSRQEAWRGTGTILLVDDDPVICEVGREMLECLGLNVLTAADGREAVERFRERTGKIDCVLLDLSMPKLDGEQVFLEMRTIDPAVKVVLCSGFTEEDATRRLIGRGLAGFLQKPYDVEQLAKVLRRVLGADIAV